jgi:hypothetical protein
LGKRNEKKNIQKRKQKQKKTHEESYNILKKKKTKFSISSVVKK